jgi:hypothetical protein
MSRLDGPGPMKTAVQLLRQAGQDRPKSELVCGTPSAIVTGSHGPVALFDPGQLVGYRIGCRRQARVFVFRTLQVDDRLAAAIPGVRPRVQLLFEVQTPGRARLVRGMFMYLVRESLQPWGLADDFYVRVGAVLGGRLPGRKILLSLMSSAGRQERLIGGAATLCTPRLPDSPASAGSPEGRAMSRR